MFQDANINGLIISVWDALAIYQTTGKVNDLLPVLADLAPVCKPLLTLSNWQQSIITYPQFYLGIIYQTLERGFYKGGLSRQDIDKIIKAIDKIGVEDL